MWGEECSGQKEQENKGEWLSGVTQETIRLIVFV